MVVYKTGVWDLFHVGHLNVLSIAAGLGSFLVVGVATDEYACGYKSQPPAISFHDRIRIISELRSVDAVVPYHATGDMQPVEIFGVNLRVVDEQFACGDSSLAEKQRQAKHVMEEAGVRFVIVPRTPGISTAQTRKEICLSEKSSS